MKLALGLNEIKKKADEFFRINDNRTIRNFKFNKNLESPFNNISFLAFTVFFFH